MNRVKRISLTLLICLISACGSRANPAPQNSYKNLVATDVAATLTAIPTGTIVPVHSPTVPPMPTLPKPVYEFRYRRFDPTLVFFGKDKPYPQELTSIQDSNIIPLGCSHRYNIKLIPVLRGQPTATHEPDISRRYFYSDPVTKQEAETINDPLLKAFLANADTFAQTHSSHSNPLVSYVFYCDVDNENSIVFYGVGPCGGGCIGDEIISYGKPDGSLVFLADNVEGNIAYGVCSPLLLTTQHVLYMECPGEFSNTIRKINLQDLSISVVLKCSFGPSTLTEEFPIVCK